VAANNFSNAAPDSIAYHRSAEGFLDAEAEPAVRQLVGTKENYEVGTRAPFSGAVYGVKFSPANKPRFARKLISSGL
jgi:hypothetical protein